MQLEIRWQDISGLRKFQQQVRDLNEKFPKVLPRIVNQVGDRAKTRVVRALVNQTGLERQVIVKAVVNSSRAFSGKLAYDMRSRGGDIRLKYFNPVETGEGVVAKLFNVRTLHPGSFMRKGHVFSRNRSSGHKYTFLRSGVFIPKEMIEGISREAFETEATKTLPLRIDKIIRKLLK